MSSTQIPVKNLTIGKVLSEGFNLFFHNIKKISAPILIYALILYGISFLAMIPFFVNIPAYINNFDNMDELEMALRLTLPFIPFVFILSIGSIVLSTFLGLVETNRASEIYLKRNIRGIKELIKSEKSYFFPFLGLTLLLGAILSTGLPGYILNFGFFISIQIFVLEKKGVLDSMKRSWNLTKGSWVEIFVSQLVFSLIIQAIAGIILIVPYILMAVMQAGLFYMIEENMQNSGLMILLFAGFFILFLGPSLLITVISASLNYGMSTSVYYNILKDKEGFATENLAESFLSDKTETGKSIENKPASESDPTE